jgi:hypothetical protein
VSRPVRQPGVRRRWVGPVAAAVVVRPRLWPVAVVTLFRLAATGWWRRWPPLPLPDDGYWRFRMVTAYGGAGDGVPDAADVVSYLTWCRRMRRRGR